MLFKGTPEVKQLADEILESNSNNETCKKLNAEDIDHMDIEIQMIAYPPENAAEPEDNIMAQEPPGEMSHNVI